MKQLNNSIMYMNFMRIIIIVFWKDIDRQSHGPMQEEGKHLSTFCFEVA